ncbi:MAG TPA: hypothetical protein DHV52_00235 [Parachlamydiales bacterium]|nr:hypothetical protein [Parachlamydiales bacterium]
MAIPLALAGSSYLGIKGVEHLFSRPENNHLDGRIDRLRCCLADFKNRLASVVGERVWNCLTEDIASHAWISVLFFSLVSPCPQRSLDERIGPLILCFVCITSLSRLVLQTFRHVKSSLEKKEDLLLQEREEKAPDIALEIIENDAILSRFICPISQELIRHPVSDPTCKKGTVVFEKKQIEHWLKKNPISPISRRPLSIQDLKREPALELLIRDRIRYWETAYKEVV